MIQLRLIFAEWLLSLAILTIMPESIEKDEAVSFLGDYSRRRAASLKPGKDK